MVDGATPSPADTGAQGIGNADWPLCPQTKGLWDGRIFSGEHEPIDQSRPSGDTPALGIETPGLALFDLESACIPGVLSGKRRSNPTKGSLMPEN